MLSYNEQYPEDFELEDIIQYEIDSSMRLAYEAVEKYPDDWYVYALGRDVQPDRIIRILENMLFYFESEDLEEYEKCAVVKQVLDNYKLKNKIETINDDM